MTTKVNIGILGYGFVEANFHLPCYKEIVGANAVAVAGPKKTATEEFAKNGQLRRRIRRKILSKNLILPASLDQLTLQLSSLPQTTT
jgi:predicted dehydrogenase